MEYIYNCSTRFNYYTFIYRDFFKIVWCSFVISKKPIHCPLVCNKTFSMYKITMSPKMMYICSFKILLFWPVHWNLICNNFYIQCFSWKAYKQVEGGKQLTLFWFHYLGNIFVIFVTIKSPDTQNWHWWLQVYIKLVDLQKTCPIIIT